MAGVVDLVLVFQFLKRLTTPFDETEAFKLGIIDERGKKIKKAETREEQRSYGYFDRLVFNIKKLLEKLPGGKSKLASYAAALFLIKESVNTKENYTVEELTEGFMSEMQNLDDNLVVQIEEEVANVTGSGVVGTGDTGEGVSSKIDARNKKTKNFLKRYMENKTKRDEIKKKRDFMKQLGL